MNIVAMNESRLLNHWIPACAGMTKKFTPFNPAQAGVQVAAEAQPLIAVFSIESQ